MKLHNKLPTMFLQSIEHFWIDIGKYIKAIKLDNTDDFRLINDMDTENNFEIIIFLRISLFILDDFLDLPYLLSIYLLSISVAMAVINYFSTKCMKAITL